MALLCAVNPVSVCARVRMLGIGERWGCSVQGGTNLSLGTRNPLCFSASRILFRSSDSPIRLLPAAMCEAREEVKVSCGKEERIVVNLWWISEDGCPGDLKMRPFIPAHRKSLLFF